MSFCAPPRAKSTDTRSLGFPKSPLLYLRRWRGSVWFSVREYVFFVFFRFQKTWLFTFFFEMTYQKVVKSHQRKFSPQYVTKEWSLRWMITVIQFLAPKSHCWTFWLIGSIGRNSTCKLVSCVRISEQGVWCWWLTGTGTEFRFRLLSIKGWVIERPVKLYVGGRPTFFNVFFQISKKHDFLRFFAHVFSNTA